MNMRINAFACGILAATSMFFNGLEKITPENFHQIAARYNGEWEYPANDLASNIYVRVKSLYANERFPFQTFIGIRGGGFMNDGMSDEFVAFYNFVSNHCDEIVSNWRAYETNEMVRFTTLSAIGFTGYDNMTNLAEHVIGEYVNNTNFCSWATVRFVHMPYGTLAERYFALNYDIPAISNLLTRIRVKAEEVGDASMKSMCERELSGKAKEEYLLLKEAGVWE